MRKVAEKQKAPISRRKMLGGAAAGAAAVAAGAMGRVPIAQAADGDPLLLGQPNEAATRTILTGTSDISLEVITLGLGATGIHAKAVGIGVRAEGITGVTGSSTSPNGSGVYGEDLTFDSVGRGVEGISHNGWGVYAVSGGQALRVDGRATFNRSGKVTISYPNKVATVSVLGAISTSTEFPERPSLALGMLQTDLAGVYVRATTLNVPAGTLTILLNKAPGSATNPKSVIVGWFVVN